jgi:predicted RNA methylase
VGVSTLPRARCLVLSDLEVRMPAAILEALDIDGFRTAFLEFTREAYLSIPPIAVPRILDAGCGTGVPTLELARLSDGEIVAVDADQKALDTLRLRIEERDLSDRSSISSRWTARSKKA